MRILIADNAEEIVTLLGDVLREEGHAVDTASDGGQAFELLQVYRYDLVLLDHDMPEMTGLELLKYVKHNFGSTKVVMISGYPAMQDFFVKTIGADEYIPKPFTISEVLKVVRKFNLGKWG